MNKILSDGIKNYINELQLNNNCRKNIENIGIIKKYDKNTKNETNINNNNDIQNKTNKNNESENQNQNINNSTNNNKLKEYINLNNIKDEYELDYKTDNQYKVSF